MEALVIIYQLNGDFGKNFTYNSLIIRINLKINI
jgi:hypothetical protein